MNCCAPTISVSRQPVRGADSEAILPSVDQPETLPEVPSDTLLVFLGHSDDTIDEAAAIKGMGADLQKEIDLRLELLSDGARFSKIRIWEYKADSKAVVGGQDKVVQAYLDRANLAIFVFKARVGAVTWDELRGVRSRSSSPCPVIALFPADPPTGPQMNDLEFLAGWMDLLQKRKELTADWTAEDSQAIVPVDGYRDTTHLISIVRDQFLRLLNGLLRADTVEAPKPKIQTLAIRSDAELRIAYENTAKWRHPCDGANLTDLDWALVETFREKEGDVSSALERGELIAQLGLLSPLANVPMLHNAAVLCFCVRPHRFLPQAISNFIVGTPGDTSFVLNEVDGPLSKQIEQLVSLTMARLASVSRFDEGGLRVEESEIPLRVVREVISNAVAHRDYHMPGTVQVRLTETWLEVQNPGHFPLDFSWDTLLLRSGIVSRPSDAAIALYLKRLLAVEGIGRGFAVFRDHIRHYGDGSIVCDTSTPATVLIRIRRFMAGQKTEKGPPDLSDRLMTGLGISYSSPSGKSPRAGRLPKSTPKIESSSYDVFLSHASFDKRWVRTLHERLTSAGVVAYLDEVAIEVGDNFVQHLSSGIGRTTTFVIVVSSGAMDRPWVEQEWTSFIATHGPRSRIMPVLLDDVALPPFLRPYQAIHAVDRNVDVVAERIVRSVRGGGVPASLVLSTGPRLDFTLGFIDDGAQLAVTSADGMRRSITPPWRQGNAFAVALMDFEQLTRGPALEGASRTRLDVAARTVGEALFEILFSDEVLRASLARATAPGPRPVVTVLSDDDVLLSLPWELLCHESGFLVREGVIDVIRSTTGPVQIETQLTPPSEPFTVVTHIAAPEGSALSYEAESYRITHALTDHCPQTATELGTLNDLVYTVARERPRGIHFSGHGNPGELIFEDDEGFADHVAIDRMLTELRRQGDGTLPPFFFLASCHGNTPARPEVRSSGSSSSAAQLHREGVTEVVGYYGPIADELSTRAEEALYAAIAAGEPTRLAVAKARAVLQWASGGDATPFAWAQLVFYHRGPEHPLGTPASRQKLRQREATLKRTYRNVADRAFLETGFIGRRRELHHLRRRRKRGERVFVLQGLTGLGKTTLAGHFLPVLADSEHTMTIWCRRSEGEHDQAESLVAQLLTYARARFGPAFEQVVSYVDRAAGDAASKRFTDFLQVILAQERSVPLALYFDNLESLLQDPTLFIAEAAPDSNAFGAWRTEHLQHLWRSVVELADAVPNLYVVATCRYQNDDLRARLVRVSPLDDTELFRLMAWFPSLRRLSTRARARLAMRLSGHPRSVEVLDALIAAALSTWEHTQGAWTPAAPDDRDALQREWDQIVAPMLPAVQERIWGDLLLAALWDRVLDERARRMLFRMTLLRHPWDDGLLPHLGDPEADAESARLTARTLVATSLLEEVTLTVVEDHAGRARRPFYAVHSHTAGFVRSRFQDTGDLAEASHRRIGTYLEEQARSSPDLSVDLEAGHHLFEAGEYDRAGALLVAASDHLRGWGRVRESLQILQPFLAEAVRHRMTRRLVGRLLGTVGLAFAALGGIRRAIEYEEEALAIARESGDDRTVARELGNLGLAYADLGETRRAIELYEETLLLAQKIDDRRGAGATLGNLGVAYAALGETRRAIEFYEQALVILGETEDRRGAGATLGNLGFAYAALGETRRAIDLYEQALSIFREMDDRRGEANALGNLGAVFAALGETPRALEFYEQALVLAREIGDRRGEGKALGNLGLAYAALGEVRRAVDFHEQALVIAREIADRQGEGTALANLGNANFALGNPDRARAFYDQSLAIGRALSDPRMISAGENGLKRVESAKK
jgi:tetratricopeptide (TPR) repeat protein